MKILFLGDCTGLISLAFFSFFFLKASNYSLFPLCLHHHSISSLLQTNSKHHVNINRLILKAMLYLGCFFRVKLKSYLKSHKWQQNMQFEPLILIFIFKGLIAVYKVVKLILFSSLFNLNWTFFWNPKLPYFEWVINERKEG